ncbi:MAG TPA: PLDc N-terminal domain-containing protein, partial [Clostridiaceae bacterium]
MLFFTSNPWFFWFFLINALISLIVIILERKNPEKTIAWLLVFILLPPIGLFFYILFGRNWKKHTLSDSNVP